jgi:DNA/RNA endonuclease G (NUC1)
MENIPEDKTTTAPTAKAKLKPTTEQPAMPERPIAPAKQPTEPKISYGEVELPPGEGSLELDTSGNREGWNKHLEEFQVADAAKISEPTKKPTFGEPSNLKGGTEHHTGMGFHEYSAAEVAIGLRIDWDPQAGRPRKVTYNFTSEAAKVSSQATDRSFHQEPRLKGESAQSRERAYTNSGMERGHLAQREAGKVDADIDAALGLSKSTAPEVERSLDVLTNVAPMTPTLNKGPAWRAAETRTAQYALKEGYVTVEIEPIYDAKPKRLSDGTPIPSSFRRAIKSGLDGRVLEDLTFPNI